MSGRINSHPKVRQAISDATNACQTRRARVLAHPDIAARLTWPPLDFTDPRKWNGYVPPATGPYGEARPDPTSRTGWDDSGVDEAPNDSPRRAALMDILRAVVDRENTVPGSTEPVPS